MRAEEGKGRLTMRRYFGRRARSRYAAVGCAAIAVLAIGGAYVAAGTAVASPRANDGAPPSITITNAPGPWPGATGSLAAWQSWAVAQTQAIEAVTWSSEVAAAGAVFEGVQYVTVGQIPGTPIPPGVATTAAILTVTNGDRGPLAKSGGSDPCKAITHGTACLTFPTQTTGFYDVYASYKYTYTGHIIGHIEMGESASGACPGGLVKNQTNVRYTQNQTRVIIYGPVRITGRWSDRFWRYTGTNRYTTFGYLCSTP